MPLTIKTPTYSHTAQRRLEARGNMAKRKGRRNLSLSVNASAKSVRALRLPPKLPDLSLVCEGPALSRIKLDRIVPTATALRVLKLLRNEPGRGE
jgi:hypothetical protein